MRNTFKLKKTINAGKMNALNGLLRPLFSSLITRYSLAHVQAYLDAHDKTVKTPEEQKLRHAKYLGKQRAQNGSQKNNGRPTELELEKCGLKTDAEKTAFWEGFNDFNELNPQNSVVKSAIKRGRQLVYDQKPCPTRALLEEEFADNPEAVQALIDAYNRTKEKKGNEGLVIAQVSKKTQKNIKKNATLSASQGDRQPTEARLKNRGYSDQQTINYIKEFNEHAVTQEGQLLRFATHYGRRYAQDGNLRPTEEDLINQRGLTLEAAKKYLVEYSKIKIF